MRKIFRLRQDFCNNAKKYRTSVKRVLFKISKKSVKGKIIKRKNIHECNKQKPSFFPLLGSKTMVNLRKCKKHN